MRSVGETIAALRKERDLGQKELAALLNLSIGTISNYENSVHAPDLDTLCRIAEFFGVTIDYLLGRTNYRCPPEALREYITTEYTICDLVNTVLSLDTDSRTSVTQFTNYLKETQRR